MRFEVFITQRAQDDLNSAREFIAWHAPETAERWYADFLKTLLVLEQNPERWPLAAENEAVPFELRQYLYRTSSRIANRALFTIVNNQVRVLAIPARVRNWRRVTI